MKVYLVKDVEKVGVAGEVIKVTDGYATNFLFPRKLAVEVTTHNEHTFAKKIKVIEQRKEVIATKTTMQAEKIKGIKVTMKAKIHDKDQLFGSIKADELVEALKRQEVAVSKNQLEIPKIKTVGTYQVVVKLSTKLQPSFTLVVVPE